MKNLQVFLSAADKYFEEQATDYAKVYTREELDPSYGEHIVIRPDEEFQEIHGF